jgi:two-component system, OmpR family, sensor histidine kinase MtrB
MSAGPTLFVAGAVLGVCGTWVAALRVSMNRRRALSGPLHELRGSLAAIQLGLFALERRGPGLAMTSRVDALRTQAERAHAAVEDVDDARLARRSAGRLELLELGAVVRRRTEAWSGFAETRRSAVELRWPIGPAVVRADHGRIGQALDNLIVNALDHGAGIVRVTGVLTEDTVRVAVTDQGPGIGRALPEVMDAPWHARHGHGLAIAARVAELHGGRLTATSGRIGSRVEIELPLAEPLSANGIAGRSAVRAGELRLEGASGAQP